MNWTLLGLVQLAPATRVERDLGFRRHTSVVHRFLEIRILEKGMQRIERLRLVIYDDEGRVL